MQQFKFSLSVYPFSGNEVRLNKVLTLNKDFSLSKRYNAGWRMSKHYDEFIYAFDSCGVHFVMLCKNKKGHLYPFRFNVFLYDELTGYDYQDDKVWQYSLYIYDLSSLSVMPLLHVDKESGHTVECFKKLI